MPSIFTRVCRTIGSSYLNLAETNFSKISVTHINVTNFVLNKQIIVSQVIVMALKLWVGQQCVLPVKMRQPNCTFAPVVVPRIEIVYSENCCGY